MDLEYSTVLQYFNGNEILSLVELPNRNNSDLFTLQHTMWSVITNKIETVRNTNEIVNQN